MTDEPVIQEAVCFLTPIHYVMLLLGSRNLHAVRQAGKTGNHSLDAGRTHLFFSSNERIVVLKIPFPIRSTGLEPNFSAYSTVNEWHEW